MESGPDLGALGFWLFVGAAVSSYIIGEAIKAKSFHRLIETSIEKTGSIDPKLAELLDKEIERKTGGEGFAWEREPGAGRKLASGMVGVVGFFFAFIAFAGSMSVAGRAAGSISVPTVLIGVGVGAGVLGFFGLIAWLIWPKSKPSSDSEPRV